MSQDALVRELIAERDRQDAQWGDQDHDDGIWMAILIEEVGEVAKALLEGDQAQANKELIQAGAVILAWLECRERRGAET